MPVVDASALADHDELPDFLRCDICVVGTGPAGMTLAQELSGSTLRVTVLESGGPARQPETDALNEVESVGWPRVADQWLVRNRGIGGTSATWTGRCAPFEETDFQPRDWVPGSGWPITRASLLPYYDRSAKYLDLTVGSGYADAGFWALPGRRRPRLATDPERLLPTFWQYSHDAATYRPVNVGRGLRTALGPNVTVVTNATVLRVNATASAAAVESVEFAAPGGRRWTLPTPTAVLCAGGIENARLLLCSDNVRQNGLGNDKDLVGRYLMDHPRAEVGRLPLRHAQAVLGKFGQYRWRGEGAGRKQKGNMFHPGLRLSPAVQRSEQLLNCAIWVREHRSGSPLDLLRQPLANPRFIAFEVKEHLLARRGAPVPLRALSLDAMCEQRPDSDSRVSLTDRRDRLGMRVARVDWRVSEQEARTLRRIAELTVEQLPRMGLAVPVTLADWVRDGAMLPDTILDAAHPTGATRMADDPARGVVDPQCQVHGVDGLFIGGSSVFPTGAHANPTQTVVALAVRLADTLRDRCGRLDARPTADAAIA